MQGQLLSYTDSVLSYKEADVGMLAIDSDKLDRQFAQMATEDNDECPLTGINYNDLYSYCTKQTAWKITDKPAKRRKLSTTCRHLGASQGAYDAPDEVIRFVRSKQTALRGGHALRRGPEGLGSTSSAGTQALALRGPEQFTVRSAYVSVIGAAHHTAMDAQVSQHMMAEVVEKQKALLDGIKLGPLNETLVANMQKASGLLKMTGHVIAKLTADIRRQCGDISEAAIEVICTCDKGQES